MNNEELLENFLERNRLTRETWERSNLEWKVLQDIAADYEAQLDQLKETAELFGRSIQKFDKVHSVRWRVKATDHVLEKIIRKRAEGVEKYASISVDNYFDLITDLVGVRALHLFKSDCFVIDEDIKRIWAPIEPPVAYVRIGDHDALLEQLAAHGFEVKNHPAGYRSVHYVVTTQPMKRMVKAEIQVRTIFEEGWSEIDHKIRYPNFSDNEQIDYFLTIFNRMAGSADEMGGFVKELTATLDALEQQITAAQNEKQESVKAMEEALVQLQEANQQSAASQQSLEKLKAEIAKFRAQTNVDVHTSVKENRTFDKVLISASAKAAMQSILNLPTLSRDSAALKALKNISNGTIVFSPETLKAIERLNRASRPALSPDTLKALEILHHDDKLISAKTLKSLQRFSSTPIPSSLLKSMPRQEKTEKSDENGEKPKNE